MAPEGNLVAKQQGEALLVKRLKSYLERKYGGFWIKVHGGPYQQAGLPDLIGVVEGRGVGIEVKLPGKENTLTKLQELTLSELEEAGAVVGVATSIEDVADIMSQGELDVS